VEAKSSRNGFLELCGCDPEDGGANGDPGPLPFLMRRPAKVAPVRPWGIE
jgi:hypothetical protein